MRIVEFDGDGISQDCPLFPEITIQECRGCIYNGGKFSDFSEICLAREEEWVRIPHGLYVQFSKEEGEAKGDASPYV